MSKFMKELLNKFKGLETEASALIMKDDATVDEINAMNAKIDVLNAKIEAQKKLDGDKEFDEDGIEIEDMTPASDHQFAQARKTDKPFNTFGEQMMAVFKSSMQGNSVDNRLLQISNAEGASEGIPSDGGYLVQEDFATQLLEDAIQTGILTSRATRVPIKAGASSIKINGFDETSRADGSRMGGVRGYWVEEAGTLTESKPTFRQIKLEPKKLAVLYYATDEVLSDAVAMDAILRRAFAGEMGFKIDDAIINGDGSGKPEGILKSGALISQAKETGQAADTIIFENIINMYSRLLSNSRANAVWFINQEVEPQLWSMVLSAGTAGVPVYMPAGGISGAPFATLFGKPVIPIEHCQKLGDKGDIILGDMSKYLMADMGLPKVASSMHVQFLTDEMTFRTTFRVDGQTERASALTPKNATSGRTLSNFVTLAART